MKTVNLPSGEPVPGFGMGTWNMGNNPASRAEEIATLRMGMDQGATLIDTAEMYGEGLAEELVGEAIAGRRNDVFLVSKVYPHNASRQGTVNACERSLRRLKTDRIDLYLLHWRGDVPLAETMHAFHMLQESGKIRHYGVSNFDVQDLQELWTTAGGPEITTNQILYNPSRRAVELDLLPWMREHRVPIMAYSPLEQSRLLHNAQLKRFANNNDITPAQAALAWLLANDDVIVIPKTGNRDRLKENLAALDVRLTATQLADLNQLFPAPRTTKPLEML